MQRGLIMRQPRKTLPPEHLNAQRVKPGLANYFQQAPTAPKSTVRPTEKRQKSLSEFSSKTLSPAANDRLRVVELPEEILQVLPFLCEGISRKAQTVRTLSRGTREVLSLRPRQRSLSLKDRA